MVFVPPGVQNGLRPLFGLLEFALATHHAFHQSNTNTNTVNHVTASHTVGLHTTCRVRHRTQDLVRMYLLLPHIGGFVLKVT